MTRCSKPEATFSKREKFHGKNRAGKKQKQESKERSAKQREGEIILRERRKQIDLFP